MVLLCFFKRKTNFVMEVALGYCWPVPILFSCQCI